MNSDPGVHPVNPLPSSERRPIRGSSLFVSVLIAALLAVAVVADGAPRWIAAAAAAVLAYTLESRWAGRVRRGGGLRNNPTTLAAIQSGIAMANALYLWTPIGNQVLPLLHKDDDWLAGWIVPVAYLSLGVATFCVGSLRRWDARQVSWAFGIGGSTLLAASAGLTSIVEPATAKWLATTGGALSVGACGIAGSVLWPYAMASLRDRSAANLDRWNSHFVLVLSLTVGLHLLLSQWLARPAALGSEMTCWLSAGLWMALLPLLRAMAPDPRPRDTTTPVRVALRATAALALSPSTRPHEFLAFVMSGLNGSLLALFYGSAGLILAQWGQREAFEWMIPWAFLVGLLGVWALSARWISAHIGGYVRMALGGMLTVGAFAAAALLDVRVGWVIIAIAVVVELASTENTRGVARLLDPSEPEAGNAIGLTGKNVLGGLLALVAPALYRFFGDAEAIFWFGAAIGVALTFCALLARWLGAHPGGSQVPETTAASGSGSPRDPGEITMRAGAVAVDYDELDGSMRWRLGEHSGECHVAAHQLGIAMTALSVWSPLRAAGRREQSERVLALLLEGLAALADGNREHGLTVLGHVAIGAWRLPLGATATLDSAAEQQLLLGLSVVAVPYYDALGDVAKLVGEAIRATGRTTVNLRLTGPPADRSRALDAIQIALATGLVVVCELPAADPESALAALWGLAGGGPVIAELVGSPVTAYAREGMRRWRLDVSADTVRISAG